MKSIFFKTLALSLIAISLWSCKKDENKVVSNVSPAGALTASATALNLVQVNATQPAFTLSFPASTVTGYMIPVTSTLQFDVKGKNFSAPREVVVAQTTYSPTVNELNTMLLSLGLPVGVSAEVEVRLRSAPAANAITYSNVVSLTATPYLASAWIYVPGAYQGWNPATADSLVSLSSNGIYTGIIAFTPGNFGFKVTPRKVWDVAYGDEGGGAFSTAGADFNAPAAGLQQLTFDVNQNKWTIKPAVFWTVIGSATPKGWDGDTELKFINDGKDTWKTTVNLTAGALKFRQNSDWGVNLGGSNGALTAGGSDIAVAEAGNYTISLTVIFNVTTEVYTGNYTLVKN